MRVDGKRGPMRRHNQCDGTIGIFQDATKMRTSGTLFISLLSGDHCLKTTFSFCTVFGISCVLVCEIFVKKIWANESFLNLCLGLDDVTRRIFLNTQFPGLLD